MTAIKLSINKSYTAICVVFMFLSAIMTGLLYWITQNMTVVWCALLFSILTFLLLASLILMIRKSLAAFSDTLCTQLDAMMSDGIVPLQLAE